jgi:hypothetical protein
MAITARIQNTRSARRTALRAARQERCAPATRSSAAVSPVLMEDHPQLEVLVGFDARNGSSSSTRGRTSFDWMRNSQERELGQQIRVRFDLCGLASP